MVERLIVFVVSVGCEGVVVVQIKMVDFRKICILEAHLQMKGKVVFDV